MRGVSRRLVGDPLHAAVERIRETAGEIDQPLREILVGALEVDDHRHAVLEAVGDLLGVVEAPRQDEVHLDRRRIRHRLDAAQAARRARGGGGFRLRLGVRPVIEVASTARLQPADVGPLSRAVAALEDLVGGVAVVVPVVLLGDAVANERGSDVCKSHLSRRLWPKEDGSDTDWVAPSSTATR